MLRPDVVVSLGTGTEIEATSPRAPNFRHVFRDGFIPRLYRSFLSSLDGESAWRDLQNRLDRKSRENYFRLNVGLSNEQTTIDDVDRMSEIREQVTLRPHCDQDCLDIAFALMASSFYFELINPPDYRGGHYRCQGLIRCRLPGVPVQQLLEKVEVSAWAFTTEAATLGYYDPERNRCEGCYRYQMRVEFWVRDLADPFTISIRGVTAIGRSISGFPQSIDWFVTQQFLEADFGTPTHSNPTQKGCETCDQFGRHSLKRRSVNVGSSTSGPSKRLRTA